MTARIWHKGPPPHVGWWNASANRYHNVWRWWNGKRWSVGVRDHETPERAALFARKKVDVLAYIEWSDYWPEGARVPRIDPRLQQEVGLAVDRAINRVQVHAMALMTINLADSLGMNVTIERAPQKPLAMGNSVPVVNVWQKRSES